MAKSNTIKRKTVKKGKKKSIIPPGLIIGGVFFLIVAIIAVAIMNIRVNKLKQVSDKKKIPSTTKTVVLSDEIDKHIINVLEGYKKNNNFIKERSISEYGNSFDIRYELMLDDNLLYKFKNNITKKMRLFHFSVQDDGKTLKYNKQDKYLTFTFIDHKKTVTNTPKDKVVKKNTGPKISIILDDAGRDIVNLKRILNNPHPITIATIPFTRHDKQTVELTKKAGKTAFLHLPGEPKSYPKANPGKGAIFLNTPPALVEVTLKKVFERLGEVDGFNNHMGSALTENRKKMTQVLKEAKKYTDTFVDSRTSPDTVAFEVCSDLKMNCGMNRKFIDNKNDHSYIKERLDDTAKYAKKHGEVIAIGHLKSDTVDVLIEYLPILEKQGIKIVPLSEVLH